MNWEDFGLDKSNDCLEFFNKVYEHNKDKLYNVTGSCLSRNKIKKYIKKYDNISGAKELLNFIFENIIQVNFTEFLEALRKYVEAVCKDCESTISASSSTNQITFNVILIAKSPKKINQLHNTNFFTAMLVKKILDERNKSVAKFEIYGIAESIKEFEDIIRESSDVKNIIGILPNDCEHSGKELGKELYCAVYDTGDGNPLQIIPVKVSRKLYVVIPFINNYARYNLIIYEGYMNHQKTQNNDNSVNNIIFLSDCVNYTESFMQICVKKDFNIIEKGLYFIVDGSNLVGGTKYICKSILGLPISGSMIYFHHHMSSNDSLYSFLNLEKEQLYNNHNVNKKDATEFFGYLKDKEIGKTIVASIFNQINDGNYAGTVDTHISNQINNKSINQIDRYNTNFINVDIYIGVRYFTMGRFKSLFKDLHEGIDVEKNIINLDFSNIQLYKKTELFKLPPAKGGYEKYIAVKKQYNELKKNLNKK